MLSEAPGRVPPARAWLLPVEGIPAPRPRAFDVEEFVALDQEDGDEAA